MASFYGPNGGGTAGDGGSRITSYNSLLNVPIENKNGSQANPIVISELGLGNYNLTGFYSDLGGDATQIEAHLIVIVTRDAETGEKVATYQEIRNGKNVFVKVYENRVERQTLGDSQEQSKVAEAVVLFEF